MLDTFPTRSLREMYDNHAPDYLWCTECGEREDKCTCNEITEEEGE
jgi:hypothetical protein